jgi:hypothetical protein
MLNLENDFDLIRSRYHLYAMIGKCLREDTLLRCCVMRCSIFD